ncbi:MAG: hypothetical protein COB51_11195 [Moraxellaceae bacterium]|nr:MAG: hypothetical protein COB51_11195 [Moraxellaceae bacterium]
MKFATRIFALLFACTPIVCFSEILAMVNYESKTAESLKSLKLSAPAKREEGIAIIDVDPKSDDFGKILMNIPLPGDLIAHHIFYDRTMTKAYISALGKPELRIMDLTRFPYRIKTIDVDCQVGEDVTFSEDNSTWYLTCMGSGNIIVGRVATDEIIGNISTEKPYPHGLAIHTEIDRILVTNTVRASDLGDAGEYVTVIEASTNTVLRSLKVSEKASPAGAAPVEILFVPGATPPLAYVTNMFGNTLWSLKWNPENKTFKQQQAFDFNTIKAGVPLEIYFNKKADRLFITTAKPGKLHVFDLSKSLLKPDLIATIEAAEGAHHVAFTKDEKLAFVQNSLLNLPGMSDGEITVIDLALNKVIAKIDTFKEMGVNPNSIVLLPQWNHLAGH